MNLADSDGKKLIMARSHILKGFAHIDSALWVHRYHPGLDIQAMIAQCQEHGRPIVDSTKFDAAQMLHEWGLVQKQTRTLTSAGAAFYEIWHSRRTEAIDILHGLQYQLWSRLRPEDNPASWAYKTICDILWQTQTMPQAKDFAAMIAAQRQKSNQGPSQAGAAFSTKSIHDAYDWLLPLRPPVLLGVKSSQQGRSFKEAIFVRRAYCSLPLFVMAVSYFMRETDHPWGDTLRIGEEERHTVCAASLVEPDTFPVLLGLAADRYPNLIRVQQTPPSIAVALPRPIRVEDFA